MASAEAMRRVCEAKGITEEFARQAHANYAERVAESRARLKRAEESAAFWLMTLQAFEAEG
jgi:hypothetical protein